ncbi:hypothetical protein BDN67DRAFT_975909, partial [Paxillus ammoniavirescens]
SPTNSISQANCPNVSGKSLWSDLSPNHTAACFWTILTIISVVPDEDPAHRFARIRVLVDFRYLTARYWRYYKAVRQHGTIWPARATGVSSNIVRR